MLQVESRPTCRYGCLAFREKLFAMIVADKDLALRSSLARSLKDRTSSAHERLDRAIMGYEAFASRDRYALFLKVQHAFHRELRPLCDHEDVRALIPAIAGCDRLHRIEQDLADLGRTVPAYNAQPAFGAGAPVRLSTALGWVYVAQGSNLGAAFLLREAERLGLSDAFGARHLAAAPEGRGLQWRNFTAALDAAELSDAEVTAAVAGANAAFDRFGALAAKIFR